MAGPNVMLPLLRAGLSRRLTEVAEGGGALIISSQDELGFDKFTLGDVEKNYEVLAEILAAAATIPKMSTCSAALAELDRENAFLLSRATAPATRQLWARSEGDKLHMLLGYVVRLMRRAPTASRSLKLSRLKNLHQERRRAAALDAPMPAYPSSSEDDAAPTSSDGARSTAHGAEDGTPVPRSAPVPLCDGLQPSETDSTLGATRPLALPPIAGGSAPAAAPASLRGEILICSDGSEQEGNDESSCDAVPAPTAPHAVGDLVEALAARRAERGLVKPHEHREAVRVRKKPAASGCKRKAVDDRSAGAAATRGQARETDEEQITALKPQITSYA
ncbi:MAG: hypothetical protein GY772_06495 [bacterium]|nr:hypothetical protein [bacterium]